jgi:hypothetical protein
VNFGPSWLTSFFETTGTTFWKPKMCFVSVSTVYFPLASDGSVEKMSPPSALCVSSRVGTGICPIVMKEIFLIP